MISFTYLQYLPCVLSLSVSTAPACCSAHPLTALVTLPILLFKVGTTKLDIVVYFRFAQRVFIGVLSVPFGEGSAEQKDAEQLSGRWLLFGASVLPP